jgi:hypothetical protein
MRLIGIVGMPGSGKTEMFFKSEKYAEFERFDDVLANQERNEQRICELIETDKSVLVSDIEFCDAEWREIFQRNIGKEIEWIFFENAPWKCAVNCLFRYFNGHDRPLQEEIRKICGIMHKTNRQRCKALIATAYAINAISGEF